MAQEPTEVAGRGVAFVHGRNYKAKAKNLSFNKHSAADNKPQLKENNVKLHKPARDDR